MRFAPLAAGLPLLLLAPPSEAHQTLYEAVEVNLHDPAAVRVEFTVHAPELPTPLSRGVDPTSVDPKWLAGLPDPEIAALTREAEAFLRARFTLRWSREDEPGRESANCLDGEPVRFEPSASIRNPPPDTKLPPGCLLATVRLANPGPPARLEVGYSDRGQKRLMLSVSRPGAFPEVRDVPPGGRESVALPEPPAPPPPPSPPPGAPPRRFGPGPVAAATGAILALGVALALLARRRRRGTCQ